MGKEATGGGDASTRVTIEIGAEANGVRLGGVEVAQTTVASPAKPHSFMVFPRWVTSFLEVPSSAGDFFFFERFCFILTMSSGLISTSS